MTQARPTECKFDHEQLWTSQSDDDGDDSEYESHGVISTSPSPRKLPPVYAPSRRLWKMWLDRVARCLCSSGLSQQPVEVPTYAMRKSKWLAATAPIPPLTDEQRRAFRRSNGHNWWKPLNMCAGVLNQHWDTQAGTRELIQNWLDGCKDVALELGVVSFHIVPIDDLRSDASMRRAFAAVGMTSAVPRVKVEPDADADAMEIDPVPALPDEQWLLGSLWFEENLLPAASAASAGTDATFRLTLENEAVRLDHSIFVLGRSGKQNSNVEINRTGLARGTNIDGPIGRFGDGLKMGLLSIIMAGASCQMFTNQQLWHIRVPKHTGELQLEIILAKSNICSQHVQSLVQVGHADSVVRIRPRDDCFRVVVDGLKEDAVQWNDILPFTTRSPSQESELPQAAVKSESLLILNLRSEATPLVFDGQNERLKEDLGAVAVSLEMNLHQPLVERPATVGEWSAVMVDSSTWCTNLLTGVDQITVLDAASGTRMDGIELLLHQQHHINRIYHRGIFIEPVEYLDSIGVNWLSDITLNRDRKQLPREFRSAANFARAVARFANPSEYTCQPTPGAFVDAWWMLLSNETEELNVVARCVDQISSFDSTPELLRLAHALQDRMLAVVRARLGPWIGNVLPILDRNASAATSLTCRRYQYSAARIYHLYQQADLLRCPDAASTVALVQVSPPLFHVLFTAGIKRLAEAQCTDLHMRIAACPVMSDSDARLLHRHAELVRLEQKLRAETRRCVHLQVLDLDSLRTDAAIKGRLTSGALLQLHVTEANPGGCIRLGVGDSILEHREVYHKLLANESRIHGTTARPCIQTSSSSHLGWLFGDTRPHFPCECITHACTAKLVEFCQLSWETIHRQAGQSAQDDFVKLHTCLYPPPVVDDCRVPHSPAGAQGECVSDDDDGDQAAEERQTPPVSVPVAGATESAKCVTMRAHLKDCSSCRDHAIAMHCLIEMEAAAAEEQQQKPEEEEEEERKQQADDIPALEPPTSSSDNDVRVKKEDDAIASRKRKNLNHSATFEAAQQAAKKKRADAHQGDDEVEVLKLVQTSIRTASGEVFNVDGARIDVRPSALVTGESGLWSCEAIAPDTLVTWYTGEAKLTPKTVARTMHSASKKEEAFYFFDVAVNGRISYYINGFVPDRLFGGDKRCAGTYINHHRERANVAFEVVRVSGLPGGIGVHRVCLRALCPVPANTELLVDYGDRFHNQLLEQGILKE